MLKIVVQVGVEKVKENHLRNLLDHVKNHILNYNQ